ncbi:MAG: DUF718 domain-containing protein [Hyphomicrobiales bacterium]|nr:MAG: DUF718 domain-containing protein [Hyphomicrobiales bacterium]
MSAMNIVHMRVKPGKEDEFLALHQSFSTQPMSGSQSFEIVKTGERSFCIVGRWQSMEALVAARPAMIGNLDRLRPLLEDLGGGRGVTEPWSGNVVLSRMS